MSFSKERQQLLGEFQFCVENEKIPPLGGYLLGYLKNDGSV